MSRHVVWTAHAERERDRLERTARARVLTAVERLAINPGTADIRKLAGQAGLAATDFDPEAFDADAIDRAWAAQGGRPAPD